MVRICRPDCGRRPRQVREASGPGRVETVRRSVRSAEIPGAAMTTPDRSDRLADLRHRLGRTGIWAPPPERFGSDGRELAEAVEQAGFGSLWTGGSHLNPEAFTQLVAQLDGSAKLIVGTGIASIWGREPSDMRQGADTLAKGFPGRFILGLGVSHAPAVES